MSMAVLMQVVSGQRQRLVSFAVDVVYGNAVATVASGLDLGGRVRRLCCKSPMAMASGTMVCCCCKMAWADHGRSIVMEAYYNNLNCFFSF